MESAKRTNTNNNNVNNNSSTRTHYEAAMQWGEWTVSLPYLLFGNTYRAGTAIKNYAENGVGGSKKRSVEAVIEKEVPVAEEYKELSMGENIMLMSKQRENLTQDILEGKASVLALGIWGLVETPKNKWDNTPIEKIQIDDNLKEIVDGYFIKDLKVLYRQPFYQILYCTRDFYIRNSAEKETLYKECSIVPVLPFTLKGADHVPSKGVFFEDRSLQPIIDDAADVIKMLINFFDYVKQYQSVFFEKELNTETRQKLLEEANERANLIKNRGLESTQAMELDLIDKNSKKLSRQEKRKQQREVKKATQPHSTVKIDLKDVFCNEFSNEDAQAQIMFNCARLKESLIEIEKTLSNMRPCAMNMHNMYVTFYGLYFSRFVDLRNPYSVRFAVRIEGPLCQTMSDLARNFHVSASLGFKGIGGNVETIKELESHYYEEMLSRGMQIVFKSAKPLHLLKEEREAEEKLVVSKVTKKSNNKKRKKEKKKKPIKVKEEEKAEGVEDKREIVRENKVENKVVVSNDSITEEKYPRAKKEKPKAVSSVKATLSKVKQGKKETEEKLIEEIAKNQKHYKRLFVTEDEFSEIFRGLNKKQQTTYESIMNMDHLKVKNDDINELVPVLADAVEQLLGKAVANEVMKIKAHNAHSKDTKNLQPAAFLKYLRPRFILLGLFNPKSVQLTNDMDHSAYSKYFNQKIHERLNRQGFYEKNAIVEYLKENTELLAMAINH